MQGIKKSALKGVADSLKLSPPKYEHQSNPVLSYKGTHGKIRITPGKYLEITGICVPKNSDQPVQIVAGRFDIWSWRRCKTLVGMLLGPQDLLVLRHDIIL